MISFGWSGALRPSGRPPPAEERPQGASRSTQNGNATLRRVRAISPALILLLVAVALAGCGKKGNPQPPPDEPNTYPRVYPNA
jgi:predicted small lipoprotein YifL